MKHLFTATIYCIIGFIFGQTFNNYLNKIELNQIHNQYELIQEQNIILFEFYDKFRADVQFRFVPGTIQPIHDYKPKFVQDLIEKIDMSRK